MILIIAALAAFAQDAPPADGVHDRLRGQRISVDFSSGVTLAEAIDQIKEQIRMEIVLGGNVRETRERPDVTLKMTNCSARTVLKTLLGDKGLTMVYRKGVLVIVDKKEVDQKTVTRVYDVRDLLLSLKDFPSDRLRLDSEEYGGLSG